MQLKQILPFSIMTIIIIHYKSAQLVFLHTQNEYLEMLRIG